MSDRRPARALLAGVAALALSSAACPNVVIDDEPTGGAGGTTSSASATDAPPEPVDRVDLLLAIDNSRSMADKQLILSLAVPDLVKSLVNPHCVDEYGKFVAVPGGPLEQCPPGAKRAFKPVLDIHVGIVSSSLGGHGSDACKADVAGKASNNDRGRLIARIDPTQPTEVETYQSLKFLAWDPAQKLVPPGEADIESDGVDGDTTALVPALRDMVLGVGQIGCGYESQLESWYRFLVDPAPPANVTLDAKGNVLLEGVDDVLLHQRKAFLRPDSALAIVMLTDENDCSIKESKQFYFVAQQKSGNGSAFRLPRARAICETDPNDECCFSCGQKGPADSVGNPLCPADPSCKDGAGKTAYHDELTDDINLRCFHQKRRFGIDFLHPVERYVDALTAKVVTDHNGQVVSNPIFSDLDPSDTVTHVRSPSSVILAGIVGVPWQDIARQNASGVPDLKAGLDEGGQPVGGFKSAAQLAQLLPGKEYDTWGAILGDFAGYGLARDPLMIESIGARSGANPITGDPMVTSAQPLANKINGHDFSIPKQDDLQYACIFPLVKVDELGNVSPDVRDCLEPGLASCDCAASENDSPLCQVNPATGTPTNQVAAKAYPGLRHLAVLQKLGDQGVVASVCPAQLNQPSESDFGYRPAVAAIVERLRLHLQVE